MGECELRSERTTAGPSAPLRNASLRMTNLEGVRAGDGKNKSRSFGSAEKRFAQDDKSLGECELRSERTTTGPSAPLRNASLRMTNLEGVRAEKRKNNSRSFGSAYPTNEDLFVGTPIAAQLRMTHQKSYSW